MCGISGIINYDFIKEVESNTLEAITNSIAHRGPDGFGYWIKKNIGFGHRRLSIIDLEGSKQPMSIEKERFVITYNGEIYNYLELKSQLKKLGCTFHTDGDTEVILKAYEYWGTDCLHKFRGMFAFAIADSLKKEVFIARDHFGIKPLVYYKGKSFFMFGSEIQQFKKHPGFLKNIDVNALSEYFKYGYIPAPLTIYQDLYKLEPGNYLRIGFDGKTIEHKEYYDVNFQPDNSVSYSKWVEKVENAIEESVNYHKIADVPYGTFLSGGIDSSLITSSIAQNGKEVNAFTMGFSNEEYNEVPFAKQVAEKYAVKHHIEYVDMEDMEMIFPKLIQHYGEPFSDSSAIPTYYITKKIREHLPVVLSGDGADEAFGGYNSYQNYLKIKKPHPPKKGYKNWLKTGLKYTGKTFKTMPRTPNIEDWISIVSIDREQEAKKIFNAETSKNIDFDNSVFKSWYKKAQSNKLDMYSTASYLDYKTYMHGDILTKVDIASMMNSLEVRTPFVDVEIVNLMAQIPTKHKISRNFDGSWEKKKILNSIAEKRFGTEFIKRKKKGFSIPLSDWFQNGTTFGNEFEKVIGNKNSRIFEFLESKEVQSKFKVKNEFNYSKLYQLFFLEKWLENES